jgi:hypothetical protein
MIGSYYSGLANDANVAVKVTDDVQTCDDDAPAARDDEWLPKGPF